MYTIYVGLYSLRHASAATPDNSIYMAAADALLPSFFIFISRFISLSLVLFDPGTIRTKWKFFWHSPTGVADCMTLPHASARPPKITPCQNVLTLYREQTAPIKWANTIKLTKGSANACASGTQWFGSCWSMVGPAAGPLEAWWYRVRSELALPIPLCLSPVFKLTSLAGKECSRGIYPAALYRSRHLAAFC